MSTYKFDDCNKFHDDTCPILKEILRHFTLEENGHRKKAFLDGVERETLSKCETCSEFQPSHQPSTKESSVWDTPGARPEFPSTFGEGEDS